MENNGETGDGVGYAVGRRVHGISRRVHGVGRRVLGLVGLRSGEREKETQRERSCGDRHGKRQEIIEPVAWDWELSEEKLQDYCSDEDPDYIPTHEEFEQAEAAEAKAIEIMEKESVEGEMLVECVSTEETVYTSSEEEEIQHTVTPVNKVQKMITIIVLDRFPPAICQCWNLKGFLFPFLLVV